MMIWTTSKGQVGLRGVRVAITALVFLMPPALRAEVQNDAIGFSTNHVLESSLAGEHIDTMTGNLTLSIPLGPRYQLHDGFGYGLTLYYNSKIWEHECPLNEYEYCPGQIVASDTYGLGFSLVPARVYRKTSDKSFVYRLAMEDGSEHFFCHAQDYTGGCQGNYTIDQSRMWVGATGNGWEVLPGDGRRIILGHVVDANEALVSRIESIHKKPDGVTPVQWVDFNYSGPTSRRLSSIVDSQLRTISFNYVGSKIEINFPGFAQLESPPNPPPAPSKYVLNVESLTVHDPSDYVQGQHHTYPRTVLASIEYPELASTEKYTFNYNRDTTTPRGWLLQRTLPTGARVDYFHREYSTSPKKPRHSELYLKELTTGGSSYRWTWTRFQGVEGIGQYFQGSNPHYVRVLDPFHNLTTYRFGSTEYPNVPTVCPGGECANNWFDGLLLESRTYVGPQPDDNRLVQAVNYEWDVDRTAGTPKMFQYRAPRVGSPTPEPTANSVAVNVRGIKEESITPAGGSFVGRTLRTESSDVYYMLPRQRDEYVNGELYRRTITDWTGSDYSRQDHNYVEVRRGDGSVISRVDRRFASGRLECEVRRSGSSGIILQGCSDAQLQLAAGDIATVNTYDANSGALTSTVTKGGDDALVPPRSVAMAYTAGGYLKSKTIGNFFWKAVDRKVDFNSGLTFETRDPAGNRLNYEWDELGRLTRIVPPSPEKPTEISYPNVREARVRHEWSPSNFVESVYLYDDLGRLIQTKRRNINSSYDVQFTEYDVANRVTRKSEWAREGTPTAQLKWTTFDYRSTYQPLEPIPGHPTTYPDPLGRVHGVTTSDDATPQTPTTETNYYGNTTVVTVRDIRGSVYGSDTSLTSTTTFTNDARGRLIQVDSPANGADAAYEYDESNNLLEVRLTNPADPTQVQVRRFEYDRHNRLRRASNPETGTTEYLSYDARGNLLSYRDARMNTFKLAYDAADRLLSKKLVVSGVDTLLVENVYDDSAYFDSGGSYGRLVQQQTFEVGAQVSQVRFHYGEANSSAACTLGTRGYSGLNGRLAWQSTVLSGWSMEVKTEHCQDEMGMPYLLAYPDSQGSGRTRTKLAYNYKNGYFWELHDLGRNHQLIRDVAYGPGGVATTITRGNLLTDQIDLDVRNRPKQIIALGYRLVTPEIPLECNDPFPGGPPEEIVIGECNPEPYPVREPLWDSGPYSYDMAGNIRSIGADQYYYDELGRITRAVVMAPNAVIHDQEYSFDPFGNMLQHKDTLSTAIGDPKIRSYTVDWETNRLTLQSRTNYGSFNPLSYAFDENGNVISEGSRGFVFDPEGRLREITDNGIGRISDYHYDASGYRVRGEVDHLETFYLRDSSGQVLSEFARRLDSMSPPAPAWSKDYVYALGKSFAIVKNDIPKTPKRPWTSVVSPGSITLQWAPHNEPDLLGYSLERSVRSGPTALWGAPTPFSFPAGQAGYTDTLSPAAGYDTQVKYSLRAMDTAGNLSEPAPDLIVRPGAGRPNPPAPTNLNGTPGDRSVTLTWNAVFVEEMDIWGYKVEVLNAQGQYQPAHSGVLLDPRFYHTGLTNEASYTYRVRSVDTAGRQSDPTSSIARTPHDSIPPGQLTGVRAYPDRIAGKIQLLWKRGFETDVAAYRVLRSPQVGSPGSAIATVTVTDDREDYWYVDGAATQGQTYYYSVEVLDLATPPNVSTASAQVSARPRHTGVSTPDLSQTGNAFQVDPRGTLPTGLGDLVAEDDDVLSFTMSISGNSGTLSYKVYRKAPDEDHYSLVGTINNPSSGQNVFSDTSIEKGEYDYFVTRRALVNGVEEESAGSTSVVGTNRPLPATASVRELCITDGRGEYSTPNQTSRVARIRWSRVTEPDVRGYNVYRRCNVTLGTPYAMETFACEPVWTRVNAHLLSPGTREFVDSTVGGMQGYFQYAVRPVGSNLDEGSISKVAQKNLGGGDEESCDASTSYYEGDPGMTLATVAAINGRTRGTGSTTGSVPSPQSVTRTVFPRPYLAGQATGNTLSARVTWSMATPVPRDLKGFHVEMAGSPSGPWIRLTKNPVAWWEQQYTLQGLDLMPFSTHRGTCASFRVLAVDEDGNESAPTLPSSNPSAATCPTTPAAPANLRATTIDGIQDGVQLDWDNSFGADEYYVYRLVNEPGYFYFYVTAVVEPEVDGTTTFTDFGDNSADCRYDQNHPCQVKLFSAYYVTARDTTPAATNGESPRSNLVFWKWGAVPGYAKLSPPELESYDAIAQATGSSDQLACWEPHDAPARGKGGYTAASLNAPVLGSADAETLASTPAQLSVAPMRILGTPLPDPPWVLLDLHTDHLGTVRLITDNAGNTVSRNDYYPFGEPITGTPGFNTHEFTGHERDGESGLDYMKARYYGSTLPRFLSPDPLEGTPLGPQSWNRYAYVQNNPIALVDPTGMAAATPDLGPIKGERPRRGWWPSGPGGATGWGDNPCVMCKIAFEGSFTERLQKDKKFRDGYRAWKNTSEGKAQLTRMRDDDDTTYHFKAEKVSYLTPGLEERRAPSKVAPNPIPQKEKSGKLNYGDVDLVFDVEMINAQYGNTTTGMATSLFWEASNALAIGTGTMSAAQAWGVDDALQTDTYAPMYTFRAQLYELTFNP